MATVRELVTKWGFEVNDKPLKDMEAQVSALQANFLKIGLSIGAAAGTMFGFAKFTADAGDHAAKTAQKLGVSVEALQQLQFAASLGGVAAEGLTNSLRFLSKNLFEAAQGTETALEPFQRLGIAVKDASGKIKPADKILGEVADRFKTMPNGVEKTALSMQIFGKAGADLIPLLSSGSAEIERLKNRANELGIVIDASTAKMSEEFNDALTEAQASLAGLRNAIGAKLIPVLTPLIKKFTEFQIANRKLLSIKIESAFKGLAKYLEIIWGFLYRITTAAYDFVDSLIGVERAAIAVGVALGIIASASVLSSIGSLVFAIGGVVKGLTLANLVAVALPVAIGAAFVGLLLIMEDIVSYFSGKNSVIGVLLAKIPEIGNAFKSVFEPIFAPIVALITGLQDGTLGWKNALAGIAEIITNSILAPFRATFAIVEGMLSLIARFSGSEFAKKASEALKGVSEKITFQGIRDFISPETATGTQAFLNQTPATSPIVSTPTQAGVGAPTINVNQSTTVTVPEGTPANEVGPRVQAGVREGVLDATLRATRRSFAGGAVQ